MTLTFSEEQKELTDMDFYNYTFEASGELSGDVLVYESIESSTDIESQTTSQIIESNENVQNDNERFRYLNADCHYVQASKYFRIFLLFNFTVMFLLPLLVSNKKLKNNSNILIHNSIYLKIF